MDCVSRTTQLRTREVPSPELASTTVYNATSSNVFHRDAANGTLARMIRHRVEDSTTVPDRTRALAAAMRMDRTLDMIVDDRIGRIELPDAAAMAVARKLTEDNDNYPALCCLGYEGFAATRCLRTELAEAYRVVGRPRERDRIDTLSTWISNDGAE